MVHLYSEERNNGHDNPTIGSATHHNTKFDKKDTKLKINNISFGTSVILAASLLMPLALQQAAYSDPTVSVSAALATSNHISYGDPIAIALHVHNIAADVISTNLGFYRTSWYSVFVTDDHGTQLPETKDDREYPPRGLCQCAVLPMQPNEDEEEYFTVTKWFKGFHEGKFNVSIITNLEYALGDYGGADSLSGEVEGIVRKSFRFSVIIGPRSDTELRQRAAEIYNNILSPKCPVISQNEMIETLMTMPADCTSSTIKALSKAKQISPGNIARELGDFPSTQAADILEELRKDPTADAFTRSEAGQSLNKIYNSGDEPTRNHIREIAKADGVVLPDKVVLLRVCD